ncbi:MAG: hypothetical protein L0H83_05630 [Salinisphaera sp.]|nr:hypothetical protein [Salinisphaera sp.]
MGVVAATVLVLVSLPSMSSASLTQLSVTSLLISLMRFGVSAAAVFLVLRLLDRAVHSGVVAMIDGIERDAVASAIYLGLRFVALAYLAGACLA